MASGSPALPIDVTAFEVVVFMGSAPKEKFDGPGQDHSLDGTPKWTVNLTYTMPARGKMGPQSDTLKVTVTAARDPGLDIPLPSKVTLDDLYSGVFNGNPYFSSSGIRLETAVSSFRSSKTTENAA